MKTFDETTLRKLEQLALVADKVRVGVMKGDRRSSKRGTAIEFADYRDYTRGDDLRRLDWNVMARLERPFIKLLEEEEDLAVHLLIDASGSMDWPPNDDSNETHKLNYALRLVGALGHVALTTNDLLTVACLGAGEPRRWGPFRGAGNSLRLFQFLEATQAEGITDLNLSLEQYALRGRRPGLLLLMSDLFSPSGFEEGIRPLLSRGYEIGILHLLSPDEVVPEVVGDLKLVDSETGHATEVTLDTATRNLYQARLQSWQAQIASLCTARAIHYIPITTDTPWDKLVLQTMRARGVVK
ncbi:MAG: DUF58 domain-containing protein [Chloroflexota bacterium]